MFYGVQFFWQGCFFQKLMYMFKASVLIHIHVGLLKCEEVSKLTMYF